MLHTLVNYGSALLCPLVMFICMKGMFGGKKDCHAAPPTQPRFKSQEEELQYLENRLDDLTNRRNQLKAN